MIDDETWAKVDPLIFENMKIAAYQLLRQKVGSLSEAGEVFRDRYLLLRQTNPKKFTCNDEDYWVGFYS
jgi:hypothetical protein